MNLPRIEDQPSGGLLADFSVSDDTGDEAEGGGGLCCANSADSVGDTAAVPA